MNLAVIQEQLQEYGMIDRDDQAIVVMLLQSTYSSESLRNLEIALSEELRQAQKKQWRRQHFIKSK